MDVRRFLLPRIAAGEVRGLVRCAWMGAALGAAYGALHDQVSYAIAPEYFTRMKFEQFAWADVGLPPRAFASMVGVLAAAPVGLFVGWFLGRAGLDRVEAGGRRRCLVTSFALVLGTAALAGAIGAWVGTGADLDSWGHWRAGLGLRDLRAFVVVAWLHAAGYAGAAVGLGVAVVRIRRLHTRQADVLVGGRTDPVVLARV